ncbi:MAG: LysM peptidoglycan-binding domain-containing protein [Spirochaetales bacterium]|nr:LysM peptidoglycan-binding domain-containing protein [Spirochaetales bacterium]
MNTYTIGIKLGDGSFYPILDKDFNGKKRFILSTVRDNQESMQIDFYRNQDSDIETAEYIGSLMIEDIKPSPKGEPEIEVILGLDADNKLNAVAKNLASEDKQTLSVVLESLEGERTYGLPEFELGEEIETTQALDDEKGSDEESLTGDTYPFEEEDRRKKHIKKKRNPLFIMLFVLVGLIGVAGLAALTYWLLTTFGVIEKIPLTIGNWGSPTEIPDIITSDNGENKDDTETIVKDEVSGDQTQGEDSGAAGTNEGTGGQEEPAGTRDEEVEKDMTEATKEPEPLKTGFYYVIKKGDTLWDIAANYYRDPFQWYRIYRDRRNKIKNPDLIYAGNKLYIPEK